MFAFLDRLWPRPEAGIPPRWRWGVPLALLALVCLVYANSFPAAFIQDDLHIVKNNPLVKSFDLLRIFTSDYWYGIENSGLYRPFTLLTLALNRIVFGMNPWGFHLVNLLLHAGVTILLWQLLLCWGARPLAALLAALLFALHPIHAEVINEAVGRSELLVALFVLLALLAARGEGWRSSGVVWFCFALALLSKEHAIVLLALLPLADAYFAPGVARWRQRWPLYLGLVVVAMAWLLLRRYGVMHVGPRSLYSTTAVPLAYLPWDERALTALLYQWVYLRKLLLPIDLQAVYALSDLPPLLTTWWSPRALLVFLASLLAAVLTFIAWRRRAWWAFLLLAYVLSFAPTANIFLPIGVTMAERLAYLPSLWFCALLGSIGAQDWASSGGGQRATIVLIGCYLLFLGVTAGVRNQDFRSELALWSHEVVQNDRDYLALQSYAENLNASRRYDEAEQAYKRLIKEQPTFQGGLRSYFAFLYEHGRYQEAIAPAELALKLAREQGDPVGISYDLTNLATVYLELKDFSRALAYLEEPEARSFEQRNFYFTLLGRAYQGVGDHARAVEAFARLTSYELDANVPLYYGISLFNLGRQAEAEERLREALRINERPEAWNLLGTILAQQQDYAQASEAFAHAQQLAPENRYYQENLERARALLDRQGKSKE